jgi:nucleotide-binding universal stress UspA family protein
LYSHILIGLNQSPAAHRALQRAIRLAARFNATLTAMAVMPSLPLHAANGTALSFEAPQVMQGDQESSFADLLERARREARQQEIEIETISRSRRVTGSLFEAVQLNYIDLLVLGIHPDRGLAEWLSSSAFHEIAETATCDVLGVY